MFQVFLPRKWKKVYSNNTSTVWNISFLSKYCYTEEFTLTLLAVYLSYSWNKYLLDIFLIITAKGRITTFLLWKKKKRYKTLTAPRWVLLAASWKTESGMASWLLCKEQEKRLCIQKWFSYDCLWEQTWLCMGLCNFCCCFATELCPTIVLGSSVHGISQVRILEWVAISFSRGFSQPRDPNLHLLHY